MRSLMTKSLFPKNFIFGAATAALQIEGSPNAEGKGKSTWDAFALKKGKIRNGDTPETACDHYRRYPEDINLMEKLGLDAYRFSISWPRIYPNGERAINQQGLDHYSRLVDSLLEAGITPFPTLFHWDLPLALQKKYKGFTNRKTAHLFADYAETVVKKLGDRVKNWITINEPWEFSCMGHLLGEHAPGIKSPRAFFQTMHHVLLAHGLGTERIRALSPDAKTGITISMTPVHPLTDTKKDRWSAMMANQFMNHITLGPLYKKEYPEPLFSRLKLCTPKIIEGDMDIIAVPTDFIGINNYQREFAMYKWYIPFFNTWITGGEVAEHDFVRNGVQHTSMGWEVHPPCIYECLTILREKYGNPPVYITENGAAFDDVVENGRVNDLKRINYLRDYIAMVSKAYSEGSDVRGYFVWSLMDNFEWAVGFSKRFGLVHIDYATQKRTIKDSGYWYRDFITEQKSFCR